MSGQKSVTYLGKYTEENLNRELRKHASVARVTDVDDRKKPSQNTDWVESLRTKKITELVVAHAKKVAYARRLKPLSLRKLRK